MKRLELELGVGPRMSRMARLVTSDLQRAGVPERNWDVEFGRLVDQARTKELVWQTAAFMRPAAVAAELPAPGLAQPYPYDSDEVREIFEDLATRWEAETEFLSMTPQITGHLAYFEIVALGYPAVPLILERLKMSTRPWFQALTAMTRENPAAEAETHSSAAQAWLEWGRSRGLVD